jgi:hypothetical protein
MTAVVDHASVASVSGGTPLMEVEAVECEDINSPLVDDMLSENSKTGADKYSRARCQSAVLSTMKE